MKKTKAKKYELRKALKGFRRINPIWHTYLLIRIMVRLQDIVSIGVSSKEKGSVVGWWI